MNNVSLEKSKTNIVVDSYSRLNMTARKAIIAACVLACFAGLACLGLATFDPSFAARVTHLSPGTLIYDIAAPVSSTALGILLVGAACRRAEDRRDASALLPTPENPRTIKHPTKKLEESISNPMSVLEVDFPRFSYYLGENKVTSSLEEFINNTRKYLRTQDIPEEGLEEALNNALRCVQQGPAINEVLTSFSEGRRIDETTVYSLSMNSNQPGSHTIKVEQIQGKPHVIIESSMGVGINKTSVENANEYNANLHIRRDLATGFVQYWFSDVLPGECNPTMLDDVNVSTNATNTYTTEDALKKQLEEDIPRTTRIIGRSERYNVWNPERDNGTDSIADQYLAACKANLIEGGITDEQIQNRVLCSLQQGMAAKASEAANILLASSGMTLIKVSSRGSTPEGSRANFSHLSDSEEGPSSSEGSAPSAPTSQEELKVKLNTQGGIAAIEVSYLVKLCPLDNPEASTANIYRFHTELVIDNNGEETYGYWVEEDNSLSDTLKQRYLAK